MFMTKKIEYKPGDVINGKEVIKELEPEITFVHEGRTKQTKRRFLVKCSCGREMTSRLETIKKSKGCHQCITSVRNTKSRKYHKDEVNSRQAYKAYERAAKSRKLSFEISFDDFYRLSQFNCTYCGSPPSNVFDMKKPDGTSRGAQPFTYNGIDRIDSSQGYRMDNCVACCYKCNWSKSNLSLTEFKQWITMVHNKIQKGEI